MDREDFQAELLRVRDEAAREVGRLVDAEDTGDELDDARAVWHTAEVALAILMPGVYIPKREAAEDARDMVAWNDGEANHWPVTT